MVTALAQLEVSNVTDHSDDNCHKLKVCTCKYAYAIASYFIINIFIEKES